eukprot:945922-Prymnesium_polylepis.1
MPFTKQELDDIALDHYATDVAYDPDVMAHWSREEVVAYFENAGSAQPEAQLTSDYPCSSGTGGSPEKPKKVKDKHDPKRIFSAAFMGKVDKLRKLLEAGG